MQVIALAVFFLSGFAALLYQVAWQRMLVLFSGADVYSSTLIVAAFMAGLGVGNLTGGYLADRFAPRTNLVLFAMAELATGLFGFFSRALYYDVLYQRLGSVAFGRPVLTAVLFTSLLWPTFFMGMSLPLLARAVTDRIERAAATVGSLYALNTLGAAVGALIATWWILPNFGLGVGLRFGAVLNLACAAVVLPLASRLHASAAREARAEAEAGRNLPPMLSVEPSVQLPFAAWAGIYALSGFLALSLEITWFRLLGVMMKSTAFTFGTLLGLYLTGLGLGAVAGSLCARRIRTPAAAFLALQTAVGVTAGGLLVIVIKSANRVAWLRNYFGSYDPLNVRDAVGQLRRWLSGVLGSSPETSGIPLEFLFLYFALPAILIVPPTFLMGFSFPVLQRIVQTDFARLGRRVGWLLVANIAGSVIGTVLTGWLALNLLGTAATIHALVGLCGIFLPTAIVLLRHARTVPLGRLILTTPAAAVMTVVLALGATLALLPDAETLWARLHGTTGNRMIFGEDASGLSVLRLEPGRTEIRTTVFVNGVGQSSIPYGDIHTALGMVPAFVHPSPREVLIIGLGSGDTVYGVAGRTEIQTITCVEIIKPQLQGLLRLRSRHPYSGLVGLLDDRRIEHIAGDGRIFLMQSGRKFDIIEADALRPSSAYSGNLYSDAYFELVRSRLRPQGLAATWSPTGRVHNAFVRVFPYVVSVPSMLIGSNEPIEFDRVAIAVRLSDPRASEHYSRAGIDASRLMEQYIKNPARYTPDFDRRALVDFNTDLFPKDEFDLTIQR